MADVVIGACFGDEGKGLVTDFLAAQLDRACVVRYNGGAQAGHTVVTPEGKRHVFHHYGSGVLSYADTYLSEHFVVNPLLWAKELRELNDKAAPSSLLLVSPLARVSTPYDMLLNQAVESARGGGRHGSCGIGINETAVRCEARYSTRVYDLWDRSRFVYKLRAIRNEWVPARMEALGLPAPDEKFRERLDSRKLLLYFLDLCRDFISNTYVQTAVRIPPTRDVVFEGAQGLLLDEQHRFFPHVSRSRPGLPNVLQLARDHRIEELNVYYVMRAYMTRHGAGPFPSEDPTLSFVDDTNVNNTYQGALRFGRFDPMLIAEAIQADLRHVDPSYRVAVRPRIVLTHCDQVEDHAQVERALAQVLPDVPVTLQSFGPSRKDVRAAVGVG